MYFTNPTGVEFTHGISSIDARYLFKMSGAYAAGWGIMVSGNLNMNDGANRGLSIDGPGDDFDTGARHAGRQRDPNQLRHARLPADGHDAQLEPIKLLDLGLSKTFALRGGKNRLKVMLDGFNVFNINTITGWESDNRSETDFTAPSSIVPPRVHSLRRAVRLLSANSVDTHRARAQCPGPFFCVLEYTARVRSSLRWRAVRGPRVARSRFRRAGSGSDAGRARATSSS